MDIAVILRELDAEIDKLNQIRTIVAGISGPLRRPRTVRSTPMKPVKEVAVVEPTLIVLPPKQKREYQPRWKPLSAEPRALATTVPDRPVFVPKVEAVAGPVLIAKAIEFDPDALEAAMRHNFLH